MHAKNRVFFYIALIATVFALGVVLLGAYTRLTDAGLGCPDWPGCYSQMTVPETPQAIKKADQAFPGTPVQETKAWTEMVHRYAAGTLGILILALFLIGIAKRKLTDYQPLLVPSLLVLLVIFQALLGMWTVTEKLLPLVVMGHLLGGFTILALLWLLALRLGNCSFIQNIGQHSKLRKWTLLGLLILIIQIILGGWTSTNYAALACPGFPLCFSNHAMTWDFAAAFSMLTPVGHMVKAGLATIQMMHRFWGLFTFAYLLFLGICFIAHKGRDSKILGIVLVILLLAQVSLGIANVVDLLPLKIAVAHNGVAALLLLTMVTVMFGLFAKKSENS